MAPTATAVPPTPTATAAPPTPTVTPSDAGTQDAAGDGADGADGAASGDGTGDDPDPGTSGDGTSGDGSSDDEAAADQLGAEVLGAAIARPASVFVGQPLTLAVDPASCDGELELRIDGATVGSVTGAVSAVEVPTRIVDIGTHEASVFCPATATVVSTTTFNTVRQAQGGRGRQNTATVTVIAVFMLAAMGVAVTEGQAHADTVDIDGGSS